MACSEGWDLKINRSRDPSTFQEPAGLRTRYFPVHAIKAGQSSESSLLSVNIDGLKERRDNALLSQPSCTLSSVVESMDATNASAWSSTFRLRS